MTIKNKQITEEIIKKIKKKKKKIILCHGVFDLLHLGHLDYFFDAKNYGDILIVSLTHDDYINKGAGRPFFNLDERKKVISALDVVDYVIESNATTSIDVIKLIKPDIYFKGLDYKNLDLDTYNSTKYVLNIIYPSNKPK